jgi:hypothetical protein
MRNIYAYMCAYEMYIFHTELIAAADTSSCWMSSGAEECPLDILGCEHTGRDVFTVSKSLLEDLKLRRRSEITLEFGITSLLAETGHSQDSD